MLKLVGLQPAVSSSRSGQREREMVDGESSGAEALEKLAKHEAAECDTNHQNGDSQLNSF